MPIASIFPKTVDQSGLTVGKGLWIWQRALDLAKGSGFGKGLRVTNFAPRSCGRLVQSLFLFLCVAEDESRIESTDLADRCLDTLVVVRTVDNVSAEVEQSPDPVTMGIALRFALYSMHHIPMHHIQIDGGLIDWIDNATGFGHLQSTKDRRSLIPTFQC